MPNIGFVHIVRITHGNLFAVGDFIFIFWTHFTNCIENAQKDFTFL